MAHLWKRGNIWWFRMRCPKRFLPVYKQPYVCQSLKTDSKVEAEAMVPLIKQRALLDLEARLVGRASNEDRASYEKTLALAKAHNSNLVTSEALVAGDFAELLSRLRDVKAQDPSGQSAYFASQLGGFEIPNTTLSQAAEDMERLREPEVRYLNPRQRKDWLQKWKRAASEFCKACGNKPISKISTNDAHKLRRHWAKRVQTEMIETEYANKHLGYIARIIECFYEDLELDDIHNPFAGVRIKQKQPWELKKKPERKREFTPAWIKKNILSPGPMDSLNSEARDILIVCAETGCRASEVFDVPQKSIFLDVDIPHLRLKIEEDTSSELDDGRRVLKTAASIRDVPIVGAALAAMKRNPEGFPRYRGTPNFYAVVNKYFRDNHLFPSSKHTVGGLRHSYESRMRRLKISNEERAQLMGHSLHRIRGREVYGDETSLRIRALYAEMIAFSTDFWSPRTYTELTAAIDDILDAEGFKRPN